MFFNTYAVSFIRFHLLDTYYELNSILNYSFFIFYFDYLPYYNNLKKTRLVKKLNTFIFYVAYTLFSAYEIHTGNHLSCIRFS